MSSLRLLSTKVSVLEEDARGPEETAGAAIVGTAERKYANGVICGEKENPRTAETEREESV